MVNIKFVIINSMAVSYCYWIGIDRCEKVNVTSSKYYIFYVYISYLNAKPYLHLLN